MIVLHEIHDNFKNKRLLKITIYNISLIVHH